MKTIASGLVLLAICTLPSVSYSQTRAFTQDLFQKKSHDFGTVARAAHSDYVFEFTNNTKNTIEVSSARTSCNCTTPKVVKRVVKPGEKGGIHCRFNTRSFLGQRRATVTVTFSRPYFAEVQLEVKGYVRRDIVVHPAAIDFQNVKEGVGATKKVSIEYAGKDTWKITNIKSSNPDIDFKLKETHRGKRLVGYELEASLKPGAKPGYLDNLQLMLTTNDNRMNKFPISVSGKVEETISVSPRSIDVSATKSGDKVSRKLILKGPEPFQILDVKSSDERLKAKLTASKKKLHIVPITFEAGEKTGPVSAKLEIVTDLGGVIKIIDLTGTIIE